MTNAISSGFYDSERAKRISKDGSEAMRKLTHAVNNSPRFEFDNVLHDLQQAMKHVELQSKALDETKDAFNELKEFVEREFAPAKVRDECYKLIAAKDATKPKPNPAPQVQHGPVKKGKCGKVKKW